MVHKLPISYGLRKFSSKERFSKASQVITLIPNFSKLLYIIFTRDINDLSLKALNFSYISQLDRMYQNRMNTIKAAVYAASTTKQNKNKINVLMHYAMPPTTFNSFIQCNASHHINIYSHIQLLGFCQHHTNDSNHIKTNFIHVCSATKQLSIHKPR